MKYKIHKLLYVLLAFLLLVDIGDVSAQITHTADGNVDKQADALLSRAAGVFKKQAMSFRVTMINQPAPNVKSSSKTSKLSADVLYSSGCYRVTLPDMVLYCDGKSVWQWDKKANEVNVNPLSDSQDDLMNPASLLANYKKNFRAKYIRQEDNGDAVIDLIPKKSKSYHKIRLVLASKSATIKSMTLHNYDGSRGQYQVGGIKKVKCVASDFAFNAAANPSVEIIDMR
ncbi:MAG: outer membrane lipoprotein carrier protein LolA [Bacteroidales bacterium]|nr:outer membrane lipoprotein carrier protein LolA [Candidatus Colimorpha onthohippi]